MRKPIQITALRHDKLDENGKVDEHRTEVVALCDDGTIWSLFDTMEGEWVRVPDIPQDQLSDEEQRLLRTWRPNQMPGELPRAANMDQSEYDRTLKSIQKKLGATAVSDCIKLAREQNLLA